MFDPNTASDAVKIQTIEVGCWIQEQVYEAVKTVLVNDDEEATRKLSDLLFQRTNENPYYVRQIIDNLVDTNIVVQDPVSMYISWNFDDVAEHVQPSTNFVDLLVRKVEALASSIGHTFQQDILESLLGSTDIQTSLTMYLPCVDHKV